MNDNNVPLRDEGTPEQKNLVIPAKASKAYHFTLYAIWIVEVFLFFRFILKLGGANAENIFATFVYGVTHILVFPFETLFNTAPAENNRIFEGSTIFAMIVYAIILWSIAKFIIIKESKPSRNV